MNEQTNPEASTRHTRAAMRKGALIGGLTGALLTVVIQTVCAQLPPGENSGGSFLAIPWFASLIPTWCVYKIFGWNWNVGSFNEVPRHIFLLVVFVNSLLAIFFGGIVGRLFALKKKLPPSIL